MAARKDFGQQQGRPAASRATPPRREQQNNAARQGATRAGATRQAPPEPLVADQSARSRPTPGPARARPSLSSLLQPLQGLVTQLRQAATRKNANGATTPAEQSRRRSPAAPEITEPVAEPEASSEPTSTPISASAPEHTAQPDPTLGLTGHAEPQQRSRSSARGGSGKSSSSKDSSGKNTRAGSAFSQRQLITAAGLVAGLIILVVGLINVTGNRDNSGAVTIPAPPVDEAKQKAENAAKEKEAKEKAEREKIVLPPENTGPARFSFYEMLPETEIKPEPVEAYKSTPKDAKMKYNYLLQAGSFRAQSDAERMRAKLVMAGMPNATTTRTTGSNGVWYRVRIGPFDNRSLMNRAHDKLVRMQIQPMEIKLKQ